MATTATDRLDRISVHEAHRHLTADTDALLVCAYDDAEKFHRNHLAGAISLDDFKSREDSIPKNRQIIFYCA